MPRSIIKDITATAPIKTENALLAPHATTTTLPATQAVASLLAAVTAFVAAEGAAEKPLEASMWDAYETMEETEAATLADLLVQLEMHLAWAPEYAGNPLVESIMRDLERLAGPMSDEVASVRAEIARVLPRKVRDPEGSAPDDDYENTLLIFTLAGYAPKLSSAWMSGALGGRHIGDMTNAELRGVIDRLEAAKSDPMPAEARTGVSELAA